MMRSHGGERVGLLMREQAQDWKEPRVRVRKLLGPGLSGQTQEPGRREEEAGRKNRQ